MTRPVSDRPRSWSRSCSYTFGLVSNTVVHDKALCDTSTCVLSCNKNSAIETVPNATGLHFFDVFAPSYFLITNMRVATEEFFFCYTFLLMLNWSWSCSFGLGLSLGLDLGLNISVLFPSLHKTEINCQWTALLRCLMPQTPDFGVPFPT